MAQGTSKRGFASMDSAKQRAIASEGGKASSGKFETGSKRASEAGKKGAAAQSIEAKRLGGMRSRRRS
jgi:general stress protein YciG